MKSNSKTCGPAFPLRYLNEADTCWCCFEDQIQAKAGACLGLEPLSTPAPGIRCFADCRGGSANGQQPKDKFIGRGSQRARACLAEALEHLSSSFADESRRVAAAGGPRWTLSLSELPDGRNTSNTHPIAGTSSQLAVIGHCTWTGAWTTSLPPMLARTSILVWPNRHKQRGRTSRLLTRSRAAVALLFMHMAHRWH